MAHDGRSLSTPIEILADSAEVRRPEADEDRCRWTTLGQAQSSTPD
jgi:hypothetical protein